MECDVKLCEAYGKLVEGVPVAVSPVTIMYQNDSELEEGDYWVLCIAVYRDKLLERHLLTFAPCRVEVPEELLRSFDNVMVLNDANAIDKETAENYRTEFMSYLSKASPLYDCASHQNFFHNINTHMPCEDTDRVILQAKADGHYREL